MVIYDATSILHLFSHLLDENHSFSKRLRKMTLLSMDLLKTALLFLLGYEPGPTIEPQHYHFFVMDFFQDRVS
jgi:hypothetical protein